MNADEIVRIDEAVKALHRLSKLLVTPDSRVCCEAADLIESLQAQHKQAALNYQQKCRDVVELEAQLAKYDALAAYGGTKARRTTQMPHDKEMEQEVRR